MALSPGHHPVIGPLRHSRAFTLIELLVVIAIIAILAAIAFPVIGSMQTRGRIAQATNDMRSIKSAVASFYTDYQKYPTTPGQDDNAKKSADNDTVFGDPNGYYYNSDLFNILRGQPDDHYGTENQANPNQTVYWGGGFVKNEANPTGGITMKGSAKAHKGSLVDPWGNPYIVFFNVTKSGDLTKILSSCYKDYETQTDQNTVKCGLPPLGVECACLGPDGGLGTNGNKILKGSDDIVTWSHP